MSENTYWERTDSFEEKMRMLTSAWQRKDYRLARALAHSLRATAVQAQADHEMPGSPLAPFREDTTSSLAAPWRQWAKGWYHFQTITLDEKTGMNRPPEPVEITLQVPADHAECLAREVRVARVAGGQLRETPCQVYREVCRGSQRLAQVMFMASGSAREQLTYLIFYGNPDAELPEYDSDLDTSGAEYASISRTTSSALLFQSRWASWNA